MAVETLSEILEEFEYFKNKWVFITIIYLLEALVKSLQVNKELNIDNDAIIDTEFRHRIINTGKEKDTKIKENSIPDIKIINTEEGNIKLRGSISVIKKYNLEILPKINNITLLICESNQKYIGNALYI
jgi:hypothetical protein